MRNYGTATAIHSTAVVGNPAFIGRHQGVGYIAGLAVSSAGDAADGSSASGVHGSSNVGTSGTGSGSGSGSGLGGGRSTSQNIRRPGSGAGRNNMNRDAVAGRRLQEQLSDEHAATLSKWASNLADGRLTLAVMRGRSELVLEAVLEKVGVTPVGERLAVLAAVHQFSELCANNAVAATAAAGAMTTATAEAAGLGVEHAEASAVTSPLLGQQQQQGAAAAARFRNQEMSRARTARARRAEVQAAVELDRALFSTAIGIDATNADPPSGF